MTGYPLAGCTKCSAACGWQPKATKTFQTNSATSGLLVKDAGPIPAASRREAVLLDQGEDFGGGFGDVGAGAVDRADTGFFQEIIVLGRDDAADDNEDVGCPLALQRFDQGRDEGLMAGGLARYADDVDVVLDSLPGGLFGGLEQGADIDVETDIGK